MGVYIKGMEMPTSPVLFCIHPDGKVFADLEGEWREYKAVPVPPHGRLIDADVLIEVMARMVPWAITNPEESAFFDGLSAAYEAIKAAPAVIPAEEGE